MLFIRLKIYSKDILGSLRAFAAKYWSTFGSVGKCGMSICMITLQSDDGFGGPRCTFVVVRNIVSPKRNCGTITSSFSRNCVIPFVLFTSCKGTTIALYVSQCHFWYDFSGHVSMKIIEYVLLCTFHKRRISWTIFFRSSFMECGRKLNRHGPWTLKTFSGLATSIKLGRSNI